MLYNHPDIFYSVILFVYKKLLSRTYEVEFTIFSWVVTHNLKNTGIEQEKNKRDFCGFHPQMALGFFVW